MFRGAPSEHRSKLRLAADKCPYCHAKVHGSPETCPSCGHALGGSPDPDYGPDGRRNRDGRLRIILVAGTFLLVLTGILARRFPESDPARAARAAEQRRLPEAMDLVLARKFTAAKAMLDELVASDETFAEAYIVRALAGIGLGRWPEAAADADRGKRFLGENRTGAKVKGALESGPALADRAACIATHAAAARHPTADGPQVFDALLAVGQLPCDQQSAGPPANTAGARLVRAAIASCPTAFACPASPPAP